MLYINKSDLTDCTARGCLDSASAGCAT